MSTQSPDGNTPMLHSVNVNGSSSLGDNSVAGLHNIINALQLKIEDLEVRLKKYTNGDNHKRYYEKNKTKIKESGSLYLQKLKEENPEKIKEYSRKAYLKKKQKKEEEEAKLNSEQASKADADAEDSAVVLNVTQT
jgi:membrane protein involved in colicin uptake